MLPPHPLSNYWGGGAGSPWLPCSYAYAFQDFCIVQSNVHCDMVKGLCRGKQIYRFSRSKFVTDLLKPYIYPIEKLPNTYKGRSMGDTSKFRLLKPHQ